MVNSDCGLLKINQLIWQKTKKWKPQNLNHEDTESQSFQCLCISVIRLWSFSQECIARLIWKSAYSPLIT